MLSLGMIMKIKERDKEGIFDKFKEKIRRNEDSEYLEYLPDVELYCCDAIIELMRVYLEFDIDIETFKLLASIIDYEVKIFSIASRINKYNIPFSIVKLCITNFNWGYLGILFDLYGKGFKEEQINYLKNFEWSKKPDPIVRDLLNCLYEYPYIDIDNDALCLLQKFCSSNWAWYLSFYRYEHQALRSYFIELSYRYYTKEFIKTILSAFINGYTPAELEKCVLSYCDGHVHEWEVDNLKKTIKALDEYRELNKLCTKSALKNYDLSNI